MAYPRPTLYGTLYRWLMKLAHRYNWHHTRTIHPDGDTMLICDWCGLRYISERAPKHFIPLTTGEQGVMRKALRASCNAASHTSQPKE